MNLTIEQIDLLTEVWEDNLATAEQMMKCPSLTENDKAEIQEAIENAKAKLQKLSQAKGQSN